MGADGTLWQPVGLSYHYALNATGHRPRPVAAHRQASSHSIGCTRTLRVPRRPPVLLHSTRPYRGRAEAEPQPSAL